MKKCKKCGKEIAEKKVNVCPECGAKLGSSIFKKWWFWVIMGVLLIGIVSGGAEDETSVDTPDNNVQITEESKQNISSEKKYEDVDLQTMLDELNQNALKAERTYEGKYIKITGKIANFDSDGRYISIEPVDASEWNFETVMCYIENEQQREFLLEKSKGDIVTIKGKIISVGEVLGYSVNIDEIK